MHRRRHLSLALVALAALTISACDWTTWRGGPTRTGSNDAETTITPTNADQLREAWSVSVGPNLGNLSPAVAHGIVVVTALRPSSDGGLTQPGVISAYRVSDGRHLWERAVEDTPSSPTIADRRVIVVVGGAGLTGSRALALDLATGAQQWVSDVPGREFSMEPATASGGRAYLRYTDEHDWRRGGLVALDSVTGKHVWQLPTSVRPVSPPTVNRGIVYVPTTLPGILAVNATDASLVFHRSTPDPSGPAMLRQDLVVAGLDDQRLAAFDAFTGAHRWTSGSPNSRYYGPSVAVAGDRSVRCVFEPNGVIATDLVTGASRWKTEDECVTVTVANGVAFISKPDAIAIRSVEDGSEIGKLPVAGRYNSEPAVAAGAVYVLTLDGSNGQLLKFDLP